MARAFFAVHDGQRREVHRSGFDDLWRDGRHVGGDVNHRAALAARLYNVRQLLDKSWLLVEKQFNQLT